MELAIMDYSKGTINIFPVPKLNMEESEIFDYIEDLGFKLSNIDWMLSYHKIEVLDYGASDRVQQR